MGGGGRDEVEGCWWGEVEWGRDEEREGESMWMCCAAPVLGHVVTL